jgi:hypothetical protein
MYIVSYSPNLQQRLAVNVRDVHISIRSLRGIEQIKDVEDFFDEKRTRDFSQQYNQTLEDM